VQHDALLKLVTGQLGGAFAEVAALIGEVSAIERSSIRIHLGAAISSRRGSPGPGY
jgi:hypothetical protein